ncbi:hypothetical protein H257_05302 [Aphanomyces astaci]|uniref:Uncharacterized protein n=1 Tax=Aphanomyces astaci TaxID=112090 RepID=W4GS36_APHAT|nr:hypothetical protein H257_05302 [Aphanomyces astaci]ETV81698.1 hypothetical protein H257_05302 [Aphanomyces astaci]RQM19714.1 hypothetical protein B5M09_011276 [Aphanomyces astaci]|eukprot:XP_009828435.1 hypothetical protein H257_05302 [Aphanomyces astaci]
MQFAATYKEKEEFNQYWYSSATIEYLAKEILRSNPKCVAFLSTPSLYYACEELQKDATFAATSTPTFVLFDLDAALPRVVPYDFNDPTSFPGHAATEFEHAFDFVVIDPPFITEQVWTKYAESARHLLVPQGKLLLTTIGTIYIHYSSPPWTSFLILTHAAENHVFLDRLLSCTLRRYQPSIPHLVYQYGTYANYESVALDQLNPEIPLE